MVESCMLCAQNESLSSSENITKNQLLSVKVSWKRENRDSCR